MHCHRQLSSRQEIYLKGIYAIQEYVTNAPELPRYTGRD
jgi:hypothetical protein